MPQLGSDSSLLGPMQGFVAFAVKVPVSAVCLN